MSWRFGRLDPTATSVAVVGAGVAVPGCARLIHQKVSERARDDAAQRQRDPPQRRRPPIGSRQIGRHR